MRLRIAVTDNNWFRFLRSLPNVDEVNFWQPSAARRFRALEPGEPLLFKLHSPEDFIVGGGFFVHYTTLPYGEKALPALDAAHIRPVAAGGQHRLDNGLLLRSDVHRLFDAGYVTVTPNGHFLVSRRIKDDFDNGEPYVPYHGQQIWMPKDPRRQPDRLQLEWHADEVFLK